jgi:predicted dehydrogenase
MPHSRGDWRSSVREVSVALIGCGFMGKSHSNAYRSVRLFFPDGPAYPRQKVLCGAPGEDVQRFADAYGWEEVSHDWEAVVARDDIELVDIVTPGKLHAPIAIAAAKSGKHVSCEKPLANTLDEAIAMADAAEAAGVRNLCSFNYRRVPAVALAKKLIDEGFVGRIFHWRAAYLQDWIVDPNFPLVWRLVKSEAGSGALGDIGAHVIDLAYHLVGKISTLSSATETFIKERPVLGSVTGGLGAAAGKEMGTVDVDDAAIFLARFENGALGTFEATRFAPGGLNKNAFEINGSEGSIRFNLERPGELEVFSRSDPAHIQGWRTVQVTNASQPYMAAYWPGGHHIGWEHTFINSVYDMLSAIANGTEMRPNFRDGVYVQKVLDAVLKSAETQAWVTP